MSVPALLQIAATAALGGAAGYVGSLMISRRMALAGDALGHVALPGLGLALLWGVEPSLGALVFMALGTWLIWKLGRWTPLSEETRVGVVFITSLALGFLFVPEPELLESLMGNVEVLRGARAWIALAAAGGVAVMTHRLYSDLTLLSLSPELARSEGVDVDSVQLQYLGAVSLLVSLGILLTGTLLVGALVIVPPATARLICRNRSSYVRISGGAGALCSLLGAAFADSIGLRPGPSIVLVSVLILGGVLIFRRWIRD